MLMHSMLYSMESFIALEYLILVGKFIQRFVLFLSEAIQMVVYLFYIRQRPYQK